MTDPQPDEATIDEIADALLTEDVEDGKFVDQPNGDVA